MNVVDIISKEIKKFLSEAYVPKEDTRSLFDKDVSDDDIQRAEEIIQQGVDPTWNVAEWGSMFIGVTGRHQVYYTFWKYSPKAGEMHYMGNLATDIIRAAEKAKKIAGKQPIYFDNYETLKGLAGGPVDVIGFGKYRGKTLGEVYAENPQYVIWIAKNFTARNAKQREFVNIAQDFSDTYFRSMADTNRAAETKEFFGKRGEKVEMTIQIVKIDAYGNAPDGYTDYGNSISYRVRTETEGERFQFYATPKGMSKLTGVEYTAKYLQGNYGVFEVVSQETKDGIEAAIPALINTDVIMKGTIKNHKEIVGKKYTILSRVTLKKL